MKYYCLGIKGTGMSALAQILFDLGNEVSGYDDAKAHKFTQDGLDSRGIKIYYDNVHEIDKGTIVTYSVALKEDHKEIQRVKELGLTIKKYNEVVANVIDMFTTIGVSGTHGKTTTSSIIKHIIDNVYKCNYFIGAGDGYANKDNKYFVIESDEFNRHFTTYHPTYSVITNIEAEHLDCYKDINDIRSAFQIFADNTKKVIVANGDNEDVRKLNYQKKVIFYGFNENNDVVIKNMSLQENGSSFDLYYQNKLLGSFFVPLYGKHMIMDATAAIMICYLEKIKIEVIKELLKTFHNAKRRFAIEKVNDTYILDDYAHHPTEIKVTLEAVKQKFPNKRIVVVFKPNTYSRTKDFTMDFVSALNIADKTYLTNIDCNREKQSDYPGVSSYMIIDKLRNGDIISEDDVSKLKDEKGSVVCFMGCAYVDKLINNFKELLKEM